MSTSKLIRWSGLIAIAAGALNIVSAFFQSSSLITMLVVVTTVFAVIGLPSVFIPSLATILGILGAAAVGLGLAGAGYTLWSRPG